MRRRAPPSWCRPAPFCQSRSGEAPGASPGSDPCVPVSVDWSSAAPGKEPDRVRFLFCDVKKYRGLVSQVACVKRSPT